MRPAPGAAPPPPPSPPAAPPPGLTGEALGRVRPLVRQMLTRIPAFAELTGAEQTRLANDMVRLLAYMDDPNGIVSEVADAPPPLARAQSDANEQTRRNLSRSPGFAGKDFEAGAAEQGVEQFGNLVRTVDFPAFVGGLINNVFRSIVETSIEQMRAYAELVANVAKSAEDYMNDNIGVGAGRDYLVDRFPDLLDVAAAKDGTSRLLVKSDETESALREVHASLGMEGDPPSDLDDEETELKIVNAARLVMARSRQQLLASMVMLGINRIVVTDGSITAKVKFDMRSLDTAARRYRAAAFDKQTSRNTNTTGVGGGFFGIGFGSVNVNEQAHVATVSTAVNESSESTLEMSARLQGEVRVNFKSDYLPLEKMATPEMIGAIQGNATPASPRSSAPAPETVA